MVRKKMTITILISILFLSNIVNAFDIYNDRKIQNSEKLDEINDAEVPLWNIGNYWIYDITLNGGSEYFDFNNVKINDFKLTVENINNNTYNVSITGQIIGSVRVVFDVISLNGNLEDCQLNGNLLIDKTTLSIKNISRIFIDGYVKPNILPRVKITIDCIGNIQNIVPLLYFPINLWKTWIVDQTNIFMNVSVNLLNQYMQETIYIEEHNAECLIWDVVNINQKEYDALKISTDLGDEHFTWFSVEAGNIVKSTGRNIPFSWGYFGEYNINFELKSTNYFISSNPPGIPEISSESNETDVGKTCDFIITSTDPDGDKIRYVVNWGDESTSVSNFTNSGEIVTISHIWYEKGNYSIIVKARDKYGSKSDWSEPITITITNDAPVKPSSPDGPLNGRIRTPYSYSTSTFDPNDHRIYYLFNWGDGSDSGWIGPYNSNETASATHTWYNKQTYEIKVKAKDEYNEESEWSDPIIVSMPKMNNFNNFFTSKNLENHQIIQMVFDLILNLLRINIG